MCLAIIRYLKWNRDGLQFKCSSVVNEFKQPVLVTAEGRIVDDSAACVTLKVLEVHVLGLGQQVFLIQPRWLFKAIWREIQDNVLGKTALDFIFLMEDLTRQVVTVG